MCCELSSIRQEFARQARSSVGGGARLAGMRQEGTSSPRGRRPRTMPPRRFSLQERPVGLTFRARHLGKRAVASADRAPERA